MVGLKRQPSSCLRSMCFIEVSVSLTTTLHAHQVSWITQNTNVFSSCRHTGTLISITSEHIVYWFPRELLLSQMLQCFHIPDSHVKVRLTVSSHFIKTATKKWMIYSVGICVPSIHLWGDRITGLSQDCRNNMSNKHTRMHTCTYCILLCKGLKSQVLSLLKLLENLTLRALYENLRAVDSVELYS